MPNVEIPPRARNSLRFVRPLLFYIRRLVGNEADAWDVLQETWVKALSGIKRLREPAALSVWLYRVARTAALSHHRLQPPPEGIGDPAIVPLVEEDDKLLRLENIERVHRALEELSTAHREILSLVLLERFSVEEMADVLGIPAGTVKSRLYHARLAMRAIIEKREAIHD